MPSVVLVLAMHLPLELSEDIIEVHEAPGSEAPASVPLLMCCVLICVTQYLTSGPRRIVAGPTVFVLEQLVSVDDLGVDFVGALACDVGVMLQRQIFKGLFDLLVSGLSAHSQHSVWVRGLAADYHSEQNETQMTNSYHNLLQRSMIIFRNRFQRSPNAILKSICPKGLIFFQTILSL